MLGAERERFNEGIDEVLLANGFKYYEDWEHGPQAAWSIDCEHYTMQLMRHSFGYWIIIDAHASGERKKLNMGSSNNAADIIAVKAALERLF